jgi:hypothetical protein
MSDIPTTITCLRTKRGAEVSIPQRIVKHSPTGMEWGYGGSGPADFALNVLDLWLPRDDRPDVRMQKGFAKAVAVDCYQAFKADVICRIPRGGGTLTQEIVHEWYWRYKTIKDQSIREEPYYICDFCQSPAPPTSKVYYAKGIGIGKLDTGEVWVDGGEWLACAECERLIGAKEWGELVRRAFDAIKPTPDDPEASKAKIRFMLQGVLDIDFSSK